MVLSLLESLDALSLAPSFSRSLSFSLSLSSFFIDAGCIHLFPSLSLALSLSAYFCFSPSRARVNGLSLFRTGG